MSAGSRKSEVDALRAELERQQQQPREKEAKMKDDVMKAIATAEEANRESKKKAEQLFTNEIKS